MNIDIMVHEDLHDCENIALVDLDAMKRANEFIRSVLSDEHYRELKENYQHNVYVYPMQLDPMQLDEPVQDD